MRCTYDWSQYWKENQRNCFAVPTYKCFVASILTVEEVSFQPHVLFIMTGFLKVGRKTPLITVSGNYKSYSQGSNLQAAEDAGEESGLWLQGVDPDQGRRMYCLSMMQSEQLRLLPVISLIFFRQHYAGDLMWLIHVMCGQLRYLFYLFTKISGLIKFWCLLKNKIKLKSGSI